MSYSFQYYALQNGLFKTGLPGSDRIPVWMGTSDPTGTHTFSIDAGTQLTLDPQRFENDSPDYLFIEQINLPGSANFLARIQPTCGPPWMNDFMNIVAMCQNNLPSYSGITIMTYHLPEPYPMPPRSSLSITIMNRSASNVTGAVAGVIGYRETIPAYTAPRKSPYMLGGFTGRITSLADGATERVPEDTLYPGFKFMAQALDVEVITGTASVEMRLGIKGKNRRQIIESPVHYSALKGTFSRKMPLYDTLIDHGEGFLLDVRNISGGSVDFDTVISGYRYLDL